MSYSEESFSYEISARAHEALVAAAGLVTDARTLSIVPKPSEDESEDDSISIMASGVEIVEVQSGPYGLSLNACGLVDPDDPESFRIETLASCDKSGDNEIKAFAISVIETAMRRRNAAA
jgi:hypothetical protein